MNPVWIKFAVSIFGTIPCYSFLFTVILPLLPRLTAILYRGFIYMTVLMAGQALTVLSLPFWLPFAAKKAKTIEETHSSISTKDRTEEKKEEAKPQPEEQPAAGPWDELGVCRGASKDEIRRAYRELVKKWHPDLFATGPTEMQDFVATRMQNINRTYDMLM